MQGKDTRRQAAWRAILVDFPDRRNLLSGGVRIIIPTFLPFQFYGDAERGVRGAA